MLFTVVDSELMFYYKFQMVKAFENEVPNLSYVHINQPFSAGAESHMRGFITNGLQRSDPLVINADLLHRSLTNPPRYEYISATPVWDMETSPGDDAVDILSSPLSEKNNMSSLCQSSTVWSGPSCDVPVSSGSRALTVGIDLTDCVGINLPASTLSEKPPATVIVDDMQGPSGNNIASGASSEATMSIDQETSGVKRPLTDAPESESSKIARFIDQVRLLKSHKEIVDENNRLKAENLQLKAERMEIQRKFQTLSSVLKDPRKRELLHARLQSQTIKPNA